MSSTGQRRYAYGASNPRLRPRVAEPPQSTQRPPTTRERAHLLLAVLAGTGQASAQPDQERRRAEVCDALGLRRAVFRAADDPEPCPLLLNLDGHPSPVRCESGRHRASDTHSAAVAGSGLDGQPVTVLVMWKARPT